jgi:arabinofuranosyltransferase
MLQETVPTASERDHPEFADWTWRPIDTIILVALALLCAYLIKIQLAWDATPVEDAAMLLRYAQNFAHGYGLRWNIHQAPVDGATDFLYTVAIGAFSRITHMDVVGSSRILNLATHVASVLLVFFGARRLLGANRWIAAAFAAYLAGGPAVEMANGCFGAPFFAFFLLACWCAGLWYARFKPTWTAGLCMSFLGLLAGLTRPEGVLIAIMLLAMTIYLTLGDQSPTPNRSAWKLCLPIFISFTLVFAILGGSYFIWRWHYFGYPLPNPFYIKGDGHLYPSSLHFATMNLVKFLAPAFPLLPLGWLSARTRRLTSALTVFMLLFTCMWVLLLGTNNHFGRFQYAVVPIFLMTISVLAAQIGVLYEPRPLGTVPASRKWILPVVGVLAVGSSIFYINRLFYSGDPFWGMRIFARRLQPLASKGYTMVVTEAGALPFYSQWQTIDGFGLNDAYVAHHHHLSNEYLDQFHPEIIMAHYDSVIPAEFAPDGLGSAPEPGSGAWNAEFMSYYAKNHGYTLAAVYGSGLCNLHVYWVRPGFADYNTVLSDIRDHPYYFLDNGILSHDYRNELSALNACDVPVDPN